MNDEREPTALETLRKRYASGDIGEAEFEQRLDVLFRAESAIPRERTDGRVVESKSSAFDVTLRFRRSF
ncbi:SHOCT domain-containing protein [Haladaptatus caseinilyticus]|uniref:SHOCT domain-containing protein n=1 Tax=Haladaptatus caseinilyticus TaxID=2993314 RepID=UPI00224B6281|nr:SHOCT domain-containing protein [Haladaptatus caseinilyticus]